MCRRPVNSNTNDFVFDNRSSSVSLTKMEKIVSGEIEKLIFPSHKVLEIAQLIAKYYYSEADWFKNFYITPHMEAIGYTDESYHPKYTNLSLSQAAHSIPDGILINVSNPIFHTHLFSRETLIRIANSYNDSRYENAEIPEKFQDMVITVNKDVKEYDYPKLNPRSSVYATRIIYLITRGLLVAYNWDYLSEYDLQRIARAHGEYSEYRQNQIMSILKSQVRIINELYEKDLYQSAKYSEVLHDNEWTLKNSPLFLRIKAIPFVRGK